MTSDAFELKLAPDVSMIFRRIPACPSGFWMGSRDGRHNEQPVHRVVIPKDFWLGETCVTQSQFAVWTLAAGIDHQNDFEGQPNLPAEDMTWGQATEYCKWLSADYSKQFPSDVQRARLPLEAEWEYACRGIDPEQWAEGPVALTDYYSGDGDSALDRVGWFGRYSQLRTWDVASNQSPNGFGLHDMHGNVWEWCQDRWDSDSYRRRWDGITSDETYELNERYGDQNTEKDQYRVNRVLRGGSWDFTAFGCRAGYRDWDRAGISFWNIGFRVCLVPSPTV